MPNRPFPSVRSSDEKTMLMSLLDWYRAGVVAKAADLTDEQAGRVVFATADGSSATISGIVKHLALVEDSWFQADFLGGEIPAPFTDVDWDVDPDWEFRTARTEPIMHLLELYENACERSRITASAYDLDTVGQDTSRYTFTLRFVLVHMLEETARHLGHIDILRQLIDHSVGQ
jgi:uncharacterized damage-inducible protein DinB